METLGSSVTHAARLSQSDDWFVSLFPIVANVLIITRANDIFSQSEARAWSAHPYLSPAQRHMIICGYEPSLSQSL